MANLYIECPNIVASMYAQTKLRDVFGFQILREKQKPHFSDRFVVVSPPKYCARTLGMYPKEDDPFDWKSREYHYEKGCKDCDKVRNDKPVICYTPSTIDQDGNETYEKNHKWIPLMDALALIKLTESPAPTN